MDDNNIRLRTAFPAQGDATNTVYSTVFSFGNAEVLCLLNETFLDNYPSVHGSSNILLHNHSYHEIVALLCGNYDVTVEEKKLSLSVNDAVFYSAGTPHRGKKSDGTKILTVGFSLKKNPSVSGKENLYDFFNDAIKDAGCVLIRNNSAFKDNLLRIKKLMNSETLFSYYYIRTILEEIFLSFITYLTESGGIQSPAYPAVYLNSETNLLYLLNQRLNNFTLDTTLSDIAGEFSFSVRSLSRYIKKLYGKTFIERKTQMRIESAKQLLACTEKPVSVIAANVGYNDISTFYKAFKSVAGCLPSKYRKRAQEAVSSE